MTANMVPHRYLLSLCTIFFALTNAQQGVLVNGNSNLPSCAQRCTALMQAADACNGQTTADQAIWTCFCQSAYLTNLPSTDTGVCSDVCTDASDSQQVSTWYKSNCGNDYGASEHPDTNPTTSGAPAATTTAAGGSSAPASTSTAATTGNGSTSSSSNGGGSWWDTHWQWIVMVIVLALGLGGLAYLLIFLRNRHRRKQDQINGGFNTGITTRAAPSGPTTTPAATSHINDSFASAAPSAAAGSTHDSTADASVRTRDAFMPYGYGYTRSESRLGYQADRGSTVPRGSTPVGDIEKQENAREMAGSRMQSPDPQGGRSRSTGRRIVRRERSSRNYNNNAFSEKTPQEEEQEV